MNRFRLVSKVWSSVAATGVALMSVVHLANAQVELTENLTVTGFIDASAVVFDDGSETTVDGGVDQMEFDFLLDFGEVSARIDVNSLPTGIETEEAHVIYSPEDMEDIGLSLKVGRFLSAMGWECAEPICLYQYSFSEGIPYPAYHNGVAVSLAPSDQVGLYASVLASTWDVADTDFKTPGFEGQIALTPTDEITAKVGIAAEDMGDYFQSEVNAWASFASGALTVAGEFDLLTNWGAEDENGIHFLGMANYALTDKIAVTGRFSGIDLDSAGTSTEATISPSYVISDNWGVLAEFRRNIDAETTQVAIEQIFTF